MKCRQCSGTYETHYGLVFEKQRYKVSLCLCGERCANSYTSRMVLKGDSECLVAAVDPEGHRVLHNTLYPATWGFQRGQLLPSWRGSVRKLWPSVDPARWDCALAYETKCTACSEVTLVPIYRTKLNKYYWPGTDTRYNRHDPPPEVLNACSGQCAEVLWMSRETHTYPRPLPWIELPTGVWVAMS